MTPELSSDQVWTLIWTIGKVILSIGAVAVALVGIHKCYQHFFGKRISRPEFDDLSDRVDKLLQQAKSLENLRLSLEESKAEKDLHVLKAILAKLVKREAE